MEIAPIASSPPEERREIVQLVYALHEIVYELYVLNKAHQGLEDVDAGCAVSSETLAAEIELW